MYREYVVSPALRSVVACAWEHASAGGGEAFVVPDACVDVVWDGARLMVAGPDTRPVLLDLQPQSHIRGIRFLPGAAGTLLGVPASAIRDARVELRELWGERAQVLQSQLEGSADSASLLVQLEAAVTDRFRESGPVDRLALAVGDALRPQRDEAESAMRTGSSVPSVAQLSAACGVSERQLLRRCDAAFGYGPKLLARVLRFQAFVRALRASSQLSLAELALTLGYADQAHLAHDTAELAGRTPSQLRARWSDAA